MPDSVNNDQSGDNSTLEQLMAEAESAAHVPVADKQRPCNHTQEPSKVCPTCLWPFCEDCASPLDPHSCHQCLPADKPIFDEKPLVDDEGVTHTGRVITPSPELRLRLTTTAKALSEMNEAELEEFIKQYKNLVHQAELALDYRRITLGGAELEKTQRAANKRRQLRAAKTPLATHNLSVGSAAPRRRKSDTPASAPTISPLQMLEAMRKLSEQMAAKNKTAPPSGEVKK